MAGKVLKIKDLRFSYDGTRVIDGIDFCVEEGSFISILGPNGSGKSTLVNLASNVLKRFEGSIELYGKEIKKLHPGEVAKLVAVVPQHWNTGFDFTVEELVLMGRFPYIPRFGSEKHKDFEVAEKIMEKTRVSGFAKKKFNELSGGEKQRVVIAQALVQDTPLLLLDEPTSHLDINFQIELMELFKSLNLDEGKTIIGVFHDINLAANYSRTAMFLKQGKIYCYGNIDEIITKENIRNVFNSEVYVAKNPFTGKVYISPAFSPGPEQARDFKDFHKTRIHVIGGGGAASPVLNMLNSFGYTVTCGVVNNFDSDLDTAQILGISYISEAPFSPISPYSQDKNMEFIKSSDVVILPEIAFGHGNIANLISVKKAADMGKKVIVVGGQDILKRDYTGGEASGIYKKLLEKGVIIAYDINEIISKI